MCLYSFLFSAVPQNLKPFCFDDRVGVGNRRNGLLNLICQRVEMLPSEQFALSFVSASPPITAHSAASSRSFSKRRLICFMVVPVRNSVIKNGTLRKGRCQSSAA
jgi:hypothetical protein